MSLGSVNIVGVFPAVVPGRIGGIEESARVAWDALSSRAGGSHLFAYGSRKDEAPGWGGSSTHAPSKLRAVLEARRLKVRPDLMLVWHLHLLRLLPFFPSRPAKLVVFLHGVEAWVPHGGLVGRMLRRVDRFLSNTDFTWSRFAAVHPEVASMPHETVELGIGSPISTTPPPREPPTALMLSRLIATEDYKGHREVISAWPKVLDAVPEARLWIAGEGDLRTGLESLSRDLGLADHVRFWGRVAEPDKARLLQEARCFALPSRGEGFGLVYLESMRVGRPCLVSDSDAAREVVDPPHAGLAVDPSDSDELASGLVRLLTPGNEWSSLSRAAKERYEERYTAEHFQQRLVAAVERS